MKRLLTILVIIAIALCWPVWNFRKNHPATSPSAEERRTARSARWRPNKNVPLGLGRNAATQQPISPIEGVQITGEPEFYFHPDLFEGGSKPFVTDRESLEKIRRIRSNDPSAQRTLAKEQEMKEKSGKLKTGSSLDEVTRTMGLPTAAFIRKFNGHFWEPVEVSVYSDEFQKNPGCVIYSPSDSMRYGAWDVHENFVVFFDKNLAVMDLTWYVPGVRIANVRDALIPK